MALRDVVQEPFQSSHPIRALVRLYCVGPARLGMLRLTRLKVGEGDGRAERESWDSRARNCRVMEQTDKGKRRRNKRNVKRA